MKKEPRRQEHPKSVYLINIFVLCLTLFVASGVINHLAFSHHGPGLLLPLVEKFEEKESPILKEFKEHRQAEEHRHFHHFVDYPKIPEDKRSTCFICHSELPHTKNKKIRAMLNMHTNFFVCETCHLEIEEGETVAYKWYSPVEQNPQGPYFGTSYDPETGELKFGGNTLAKIAPFYKKGDQLVSTIHMQKASLAREYIRVRDELSPEQREGVTKKFHTDIRPKGPDCHTCHAKDGILDFRKLGFSEKRTVDLENLSIKGIITKYDEFYLPELFKQSKTSEGENQITE